MCMGVCVLVHHPEREIATSKQRKKYKKKVRSDGETFVPIQVPPPKFLPPLGSFLQKKKRGLTSNNEGTGARSLPLRCDRGFAFLRSFLFRTCCSVGTNLWQPERYGVVVRFCFFFTSVSVCCAPGRSLLFDTRLTRFGAHAGREGRIFLLAPNVHQCE